MTYHDTNYLNLVRYALQHGDRKPNRTGVDTIATFGYQMRFDLSDGTIPLLTTKKMFMRGVIHEILWYLQGADNIKYLKDNNVTIWDEWSSPEGHLNKVYGYQWRKWEVSDWLSHVVEIPIQPNGVDAEFVPPKSTVFFPDEPLGDEFIGQRLQNSTGDWFRVLKRVRTPGHKNSMYTIQFEDTLSLVDVLRPNLRRGQISDPYKKTVFGQGCVGIYKEQHAYRKQAYNLWYNMMRRCYDPSLPEYHLYGGRGVFVDQQWRCFSNFLRDIHSLVYFTKWKDNPTEYALDKDYFGATSYGPTTCIFLPNKYNRVLPKLDGCKYVATNKITGDKHEFTVQRWFATSHGIRHSQVISTALQHSPTSSTKDWTFQRVQPRQGYVYRQQLFVDQIAQLIHKLKINPNDRRMIASAWNVAQIVEMALPPCHYAFQCYAKPLTSNVRAKMFLERTGANWSDLAGASTSDLERVYDQAHIPRYELSMILNQRSCDIALGVPFNIVQYSILLRMIAHVVNMTPGHFIWNGGDVHIYENHVDGLNTQLKRVPYPSPNLKFARDIMSIDDFKFEDFIIEGYQSHDKIHFDVAV